ncbi:RNAse G [Desulfocapsa sulfexigens DSM 10523]|uniref:Ribonuclease G n=1 Tax=Desulfocapsa sulfexigens (strain DSM 10523 / SB164P1) TaxID=1167006 RepID=M1P7A0_DESSD|nr:Rne/Rng family ribonuclease [Desulfocapsa sulfexigens]AGF79353.1 RNAse G [Desulfocapsa sulfexigens DSM 10523]
MSSEILINSTSYEVRIALVENGHLAEFHLQRPTEKGLVGNIYRGRVVRVLPGMQAAFVDIGLERTGFLYVDDVYISNVDLDARLMNRGNPCGKLEFASSTPEADMNRSPGVSIEDLLTEGQEITVQVGKDPIGTKGARLTCHITLPCRNLVFMPLTDHIGISRKIQDDNIRNTLKERIESLRPTGTGFIVRTVAENATLEELEADMEFLLLLWDEIQDISERITTIPVMIYEDLDITFRSVRDLFTAEVSSLILDDQKTYDKLLKFVKTFAPKLQNRISIYKGDSPLFEAHGIDVEISRALDKKVWLRSGGYIIIETTEALSVIDVNTGRFVGKNDLEETIFKTNIEAVKEIAYQLRLRNIGGIIIIDFIDMEEEEHREELFTSFKEAVKKDKSRINILKLTEFGLVQMTRKRSCENLNQMMCEPCHYCAGEGVLKSRRTICYEIYRKISRKARNYHGDKITLNVHPRVADMLLKEEEAVTCELERDIGKRLTIIPSKELHIEKYDILWD